MDDFKLVETDFNSPVDYATARLNEIFVDDIDSYLDWVNGYLDFNKLGQAMLESECVVEIEQGYLRVPEAFEDFFLK